MNPSEQRLALLDERQLRYAALALAAVLELGTLALRFGAGLESTRDTAALGRFTFGLRIHHGYVGLLVLALARWLAPGARRNAALIVGGGLLISDLVHHFLVLWPLTGSPQFDLTYR